jgi:hypothetical protein
MLRSVIAMSMTPILSEIRTEIIKWLKRVWFEAKLKARLQMIEWQNLRESEEERRERFEPVYQEKAVDPVLQTGASQLLGGEMRLAAKWVIEEEQLGARNSIGSGDGTHWNDLSSQEKFKRVAWSVANDTTSGVKEDPVVVYEKMLRERGIEP